MGYDSSCTLRFDGKTSRGTAWLEHKELVFRGPVRLAIPLATITAATARDGDSSADFTIGPAAEKWAKRITSPPSRLDKLGVKPGMTIAAIAIRDDAFLVEAAERVEKITRRAPAPACPVDAIFYGVNHRDGLGEVPALVRLIKPDGAIWIVRPKGRPEITEAETMAAGKRAGLVDVKVVSFSDTHTAEKFVIPVARRSVKELNAAEKPTTGAKPKARAKPPKGTRILNVD
jgi:hypothetical protein